MINVLIIEDDLMVAEFNKRFLSEIEGYSLVGMAHSVNEAVEYIKAEPIDLLLLDVYMPGKSGLKFLTELREQAYQVDVILITAASEVDQIKVAMRYGVVDYLIKPFEFERFQQALTMYKEKTHFLKKQQNINQEELDQRLLSKSQQSPSESNKPLPKGLSKNTLAIIFSVVQSMGRTSFTTDEIAEAADISRVSVRKYLIFLKTIGVLDETMTYGIGRPVYRYIYNELYKINLSQYLNT